MGLAKFIYKVSPAFLMINGNTEESVIEKERELVLGLLPRGAVYRGCTKEQVLNELAVTFVLDFEHPWFEDGTLIETLYERICWLENEQVKQQSLLLGIKYTKPDGKVIPTHGFFFG
jgi:hypothetical protein